MMRIAPSRRRCRPSEEGYILVIVMFMLALLIISMAVAVPKVAQDIQRDRDIETYHRGMQYRRAIQLYFKKFQRYPPSLDALVKTNEIRFLRKKYKDPTTGKEEWKPIQYGQNKTPVAMGFFGQPMGGIGMPVAGIGPSGGNGIAGANSVVNGVIGGNGAAGGQDQNNANSNDPNAAANGANPANPSDPNASNGQTPGASPLGGQTFGVGAIIGFSPGSPKESIYVYKKKNHYNEWEFLYSPYSDQGMIPGNPGSTYTGPGGAPGASPPPLVPGPGQGPVPNPGQGQPPQQ